MHKKTHLIFGAMKAMHFKATIEKDMLAPKRTSQGFVPKRLEKKQDLLRFDDGGYEAVTLGNLNSPMHVFYLHGGGFIFEIGAMHWRFVEKMSEKLNCKMTVIRYPLAPEHTYLETYAHLEAMYQTLTTRFEGDTFLLMGDSAGATLAMGLTQRLLETKRHPLPAQLILFSPFLDMTLATPGMAQEEDLDLMLSMGFLKHCASVFSGGADLKDPLLSPMYSQLDHLPPTAVFFGTHELFYRDCLRMQTLTAGLHQFSYHPYDAMQHAWVVFPIKEQEEVIKEIEDLVLKRDH